jgi:hypothetical protein
VDDVDDVGRQLPEAIVNVLARHGLRRHGLLVEIAARAGLKLDGARTPWLRAWRERLRARPSYDRSYPPHWRT